jgi:hypothetical protein
MLFIRMSNAAMQLALHPLMYDVAHPFIILSHRAFACQPTARNIAA